MTRRMIIAMLAGVLPFLRGAPTSAAPGRGGRVVVRDGWILLDQDR